MCEGVGEMVGWGMALAKRREKLEIWQEGRALSLGIWGGFRGGYVFTIRDQTRPDALSMMNNIAKGFEWRATKDFAHFPGVASGSCTEGCLISYASEDIGVFAQEKGSHRKDGGQSAFQKNHGFQSISSTLTF